jgi:FkbM family methyltransferase
MDFAINNFTVVESIHGRFIVNRHCSYQAEALIKTGAPHIQSEVREILAIVRSLPQGCVIIDAGANIGLISIPIAQAVKEKRGVVHSFEAQRMMFYALCGAAAMNDLENLFAHHKCVAANRGALRVPRTDYGKPQDFGLVSLARQDEIKEHEMVPIAVIDELELPRLDFLKVDVEGMELEVLKGARRMINVHRPWCWIEYCWVDRSAITEHFEGLGYRFYLMDALNMLCAPSSRVAEQGLDIKAEEVTDLAGRPEGYRRSQ